MMASLYPSIKKSALGLSFLINVFIGCQSPASYDDIWLSGERKISYRTPRTDLEANKSGYDHSQPVYHSQLGRKNSSANTAAGEDM